MEETHKLEMFVTILVFFESLIVAVYLNRQNFLNDIIWVLPIATTIGTMGLWCLNRRQRIIGI
jgi:presenilin-like A22 family membrane protease